MIYQVKIDEQIFKVEIIDLHVRPIRVLVDGEYLEIWPEGQSLPGAKSESRPAKSTSALAQAANNSRQSSNTNSKGDPNCIQAPIPGLILSVAVSPGDTVQKGQELCVLEAMKMKNLIKSARDGVIAAIHVSAGQTVSHSDLLIEFEP